MKPFCPSDPDSRSEPREQDRIASVGLNTIAGSAWCVCWRDNLTHVAGSVDLTIEAVPTGSCFADDMQFAISIAELLKHPGDGIDSVSDAAIEAHITDCLSAVATAIVSL